MSCSSHSGLTSRRLTLKTSRGCAISVQPFDAWRVEHPFQCLKGLAGRREGHKQCPRKWKKSTMPTAKSACWTWVSRRVSEPIRASTPLAHSRSADSVVVDVSMLLLAAPALLIVQHLACYFACNFLVDTQFFF